MTGMHHTIVSNETDLMLAVAQQPVSVAIATPTAFVSYTGGVFDDSSCHGTTQKQLETEKLLKEPPQSYTMTQSGTKRRQRSSECGVVPRKGVSHGQCIVHHL